MKSTISFALLTLAFAGALSSCGGGTSVTGVSPSSLSAPPTNAQKSQVAAFMQATNRASDAMSDFANTQAGTKITVDDGTERQMISALQNRSCAVTGVPLNSDITQPSGNVTTFTVSGTNCPVTLSEKFTVQTQDKAGTWEVQFQSLDPTYSALNDVDQFSGQFVTTASSPLTASSSNPSPAIPSTTTVDEKVSVHSQKLGEVNFAATITSSTTYASDFSVSGGSGEAKVRIQFPQFTVDLREEETETKGVATTQYFVNGQLTTKSDYLAIVSTTFLGF